MKAKLLLLGLALQVLGSAAAHAAPIGKIGVSVGSLGNPYYVALVKGATAKAKSLDPTSTVLAVSADYDLNKQFTQIDNFIAAGVKIILVTAIDQNAVLPAIKRAQALGITVVGVDVNANGANAVVQTDNVAAGALACGYLADKIGRKGDVIIENGEQVSAVVDRVNGCKAALAKSPDIKLLDSTQNAKGSRDGALNVAQGYMIRYPHIDGIFAVNDPQAIGTSLAVEQAHRDNIVITSVDGAPDIVQLLKAKTPILASASQDPYTMGSMALQTAVDIAGGHKPERRVTLMQPKLVTRDNVNSYIGWTQH